MVTIASLAVMAFAACHSDPAPSTAVDAGADGYVGIPMGTAADCHDPSNPLYCTMKSHGICIGDHVCDDWSTSGAQACVTAADCTAALPTYPNPKVLDPSVSNGGRFVSCETGYCADIGILRIDYCSPDPCPQGGWCTPGDSTHRGLCVTAF
jgi:hypothetical protein